jgi:hypothetical protein
MEWFRGFSDSGERILYICGGGDRGPASGEESRTGNWGVGGEDVTGAGARAAGAGKTAGSAWQSCGLGERAHHQHQRRSWQ